jgi:uncharacterized protein (TIGR03492 family)
MKLLVISNGHGEDIIAIRIVEELLNSSPKLEIAALPIVGTGSVYTRSNVSIAGKVKQMPSGGFIYQDGRQFWRDMQGGLLELTLEQYKVVRQWSRDRCFILAVGDIVPLLFAWMSGADYAFVGTAKSEYYLRREDSGWLAKTSSVERALGSVYLPWERFLMSRFRCKAVFPRDTITTKILQKWSIPSFDLGNPMMDGIGLDWEKAGGLNNFDRELIILLLPGSRMPEAEFNWQKILAAVDNVIASFEKLNLVFLTAIAPDLNADSFQKHLLDRNWNLQVSTDINDRIADTNCFAFKKKNANLLLTQNAYKDCLINSDLAIAMAGTATEQFVGLGKPAFIIPGEGPQFTYGFAEAQTRLLGESVILVEQTDLVGSAIASLLNDRDRIEKIAINGKKRMGDPGAASRIAKSLLEKIFSTN